MDNNRLIGSVKWFDEKKGYGFIAREDGGKDVFAHFSDIVGTGFRTLNKGDRVEFTLAESDRGPKAANIVRL
jgi:CspA family cold shock protein